MENQESGDLEESQDDTIAESPSCPDKQPREQQPLTCWLYVSRTSGYEQQQQQPQPQEAIGRGCGGYSRAGGYDGLLPRASLEDAIRAVEPAGAWQVSETHCGLIAGFARESDADKLLQRGDLARIFEGPVQVARFCDRDSRYRQAVLLRDVPWAIPLQDINSALAIQGISTGNVERLRQCVRVEVLEPNQYEQLLRQGLEFFGARFQAFPERWWRNNNNSGSGAPGAQNPFNGCNQIVELAPGQPLHQQHQPQQQQQQQQHGPDDVLQCYRCQGFWHVAANCRHLPRCVRCGEPHSVEFCARPRNNPVCCHCSGPHHAGYRQCPVRLQLLNATPVSLTLSANRLSSSTPTGQLLFPYSKSSGANNSNSTSNNATPAAQTQKPNP